VVKFDIYIKDKHLMTIERMNRYFVYQMYMKPEEIFKLPITYLFGWFDRPKLETTNKEGKWLLNQLLSQPGIVCYVNGKRVNKKLWKQKLTTL